MTKWMKTCFQNNKYKKIQNNYQKECRA